MDEAKIQSTVHSLLRALRAGPVPLSVLSTLLPVVDVTEHLELDAGNVHSLRGLNQYARSANVTGALGGQSQWRLANPDGSNRVAFCESIVIANFSGAAALFDLEPVPPLATRAATLDGPLLKLSSLRRTPPGPEVASTELYFDTDAYAPANRVQRLICPTGDTRAFVLPRPWVLLPGMDLQVTVGTLNAQFTCAFTIREMALNP